MNARELLETPIADLPVSEAFHKQSQLMGFGYIRQIVEVPARELMEHEHFTYTWMLELLRLLKANGQLGLMQKPPGKKNG